MFQNIILDVQKSNIYSQKLYLSKENIIKFNLNIGKYYIISHSDLNYICKIYEKNISDSICIINTSVTLSNIYHEVLGKGCINAISDIRGIDYLQVDLIFNSMHENLKWRQEKKLLTDFLRKHILRTYILVSGCTISLTQSKYFHAFGLKDIKIHSTEFLNIKSNLGSILFGKVNNNTKIDIRNMFSIKEYKHLINSENNQTIGMENVYNKLSELISINKYIAHTKQSYFNIPKQFLIIGPCGLGKKSLVYAVATEMKIPVVSLNGEKIFRQDPGESEKQLRTIFNYATQLADNKCLCILLLEDLENICPKLALNSGVHIARISSQCLKLLDKAHMKPTLIVIATTSNINLLHHGIRRPGRIDIEMHLKLPLDSDRYQILRYWTRPLLDKILNEQEIMEICKFVSQITAGYSNGDLKLICQNIQMFMNKQNKDLTIDCNNIKNIFLKMVHKRYPPLLQEYSSMCPYQNKSLLKDIGGSENIISILYRSIEWPIKHPEIFKRMGITQPKGILMYGPPGCAKTSLACAVAKEINFCFLSISAAQLYSPYVGVAESTLLSVFQQARQNAPSIIFIDEIDAIFGNRTLHNHNDVQNRLLSVLLLEMDGISSNIEHKYNNGKTIHYPGIFVIAATNRPHALDAALMRPGRFDQIIYVPPPDEVSRIDILLKITHNVPLHPDVNLTKIAQNTEQYTGADLIKLCKEAILEAMTIEGLHIKEVKAVFFENALLKNKPSLSKQQLSVYTNFKIK